MADEKYSRLGKEEEDQIHWKVGQQFDDGSTILMVERIEDRAPQVAQNQSLCELFIVSLLPCLWFSYCPYLCMTKANMKTKMKNSALLVTDESVVFYENEWTPKGAGCYTGAVPKSHFTVSYDQLQDVRMDPQGGCETCCSICNPGPGIQVFLFFFLFFSLFFSFLFFSFFSLTLFLVSYSWLSRFSKNRSEYRRTQQTNHLATLLPRRRRITKKKRSNPRLCKRIQKERKRIKKDTIKGISIRDNRGNHRRSEELLSGLWGKERVDETVLWGLWGQFISLIINEK